jgi:hypothetical protein
MPLKNNLYYYSLLLLFLFAHTGFAQTDLEKDTIRMKELVVSKKGKKLKIKTLELNGPCYYPENMHNAGEIITLADKLPKGTLETISFYFNELYTRREQREQFRDNRFELVLYTAGPENTPGERIVHDPVAINVGREFSGLLKIDVSGLVLESQEKIFVGLKRLTPQAADNEFFIDCVCSGLDKYITLVRKDNTSPWERRWQCAALRIEVGVAAGSR